MLQRKTSLFSLSWLGRGNSFESIDLKYVNFTNPWSSRHTIKQSIISRTQHETERSAAFRFGKKFPRYLHFYNPNQKNKWGHQRGYRIQFNSHAHSVMPQGWREENGIPWSRYHCYTNVTQNDPSACKMNKFPTRKCSDIYRCKTITLAHTWCSHNDLNLYH